MLVRSAGWLALLAVCGSGCDPLILIGRDQADGALLPEDAPHLAPPLDALGLDGANDDAAASGLTPLAVPWSTGFEGTPGDSWVPGSSGSCYVAGGASFQIVTSPVHSGQHSAAFTVNTAVASPSHTRCLKQGVLPTAAYYGAWYYVPTQATNISNWNLLHFQGANVADGTVAHGLWDVSLENASDGTLHAAVYDFLRTRLLQTSASIALDTWVHLEVFLRRAADATGEFTLRTNGQVALDLTGVTTDDSLWGQWFVGNFAMALTPPSSTVYVDDVTIGLVSSGP
jgi:hypothetical protein